MCSWLSRIATTYQQPGERNSGKATDTASPITAPSGMEESSLTSRRARKWMQCALVGQKASYVFRLTQLLDMISLSSLDAQRRKISGMGCSLPSRPERRRCSPRSHPNTPSFSGSGCFALLGRVFTTERRKVLNLPRFFGTAQQNKETSSLQAWINWTRPSVTDSTEHVTTGITFPTRNTRKNGFSLSLQVPKARSEGAPHSLLSSPTKCRGW